MRRILLALVLATTLTTAAAAGPFEDADAAYQRGDYATALRLWRPLGEQGNALAQFNLGIMYRRGQGVPQDYAEAVKWNRLAAEQGDAEAQHNLGGQLPQRRRRSAGLRAGAFVVQSRSLTGSSFGARRSDQNAQRRRLQHDARADSRGTKAGAGVEAKTSRPVSCCNLGA